MNEGKHNIPGPRTIAVGLYGFLTINVIIICIFLIALMPEPAPTTEITPKSAVTEESRPIKDLAAEKIAKQARRDE